MSQAESRAGTGGFAVLCDSAGSIVRVLNNGLGVAIDLLPGHPFTSIVHPDSAEKAEQFLRALREQQAAFNWELTIIADKGRLAMMHFAGGANAEGFLIVGAGSRSGVATTFEELAQINNEQTTLLRQTMKELSLQTRAQADRDEEYYEELTRLNNELATTQRELARKNVELVRLNDQKNQFLGIAAHDLRNPLEVILTYSGFLLNDARVRLNEDQVEFLDIIKTSSQFMLDLVNNLLDVTKIEAGKLELDIEPASLSALVKGNVALNRTLAERKGIRLTLIQDGEIPAMKIDAAKIEQVLNNLISNAIKFSPPNSHVQVRLTREDMQVVVAVQDEGEGLAGAELDKLLQPFTKGPVKATGGEKSTGLGLAIVKKIVSGHGGEIRAESEAGKGATFFVSLPIK